MMIKNIIQSRIKVGTQVVVLGLSIFLCTHSYAFLETLTVSGGLSQTMLNLEVVAQNGDSVSPEEGNLSQNYSGSGFGLGVSFDVYRWISLELMYNSMGSSKITSHNNVRTSGDIDFQGTSVYAVYSYPQRNYGFQIHGKFGLFSLATNTQLSYVSQPNHTGLSGGGALSYYARSGWGGQFNASIHSSKIQVFSLIFSKRFSLVTVETKLSNNQNQLNPSLQGFSFSENGESIVSGASNSSVISNQEVVESTNDDDGDGISNDRDTCPGTPLGVQVDNEGCSSLVQESQFLGDNELVDNTLLYPDDDLLNEDENITFDSLGDENFDRVIPIGSNTLRTLLGNRIDGKDSANLDDFFGGTMAKAASNSNDGLTAEDILGIKESERSNDREDNIFSETGRQVKSIGEALLSVTGGLLGLTGVGKLGELVGASDPFQVSEKAKLRNKNRALITQSQDQEKSRVDNAFVNDIETLRKEIQQKLNEGEEELFSEENQSNQSILADFGNDEDSSEDDFQFNTAPIIFDEGESDLSSDQRENLEKVAVRLRSNPRNRIEIRVWKQSAEDESQNVAQRQAVEVKNFLLENGVSRNQIDNIAEFEEIQINSSRANRVKLEVIE